MEKLVPSAQFIPTEETTAILTQNQLIWRQIRSPFLLPVKTCSECFEWEAVEFGIMGCRICGNFHVCSVKTCPITEIESHHVCNITGAVVRTVTYDPNEYLSTVYVPSEVSPAQYAPRIINPLPRGKSRDMQRLESSEVSPAVYKTTVSTKRQTATRCQNFHERVCLQVLCSATTTACNNKESVKLYNRLRWSFMRHIRYSKLKRLNTNPNLIVMISKIAVDIENYRLPISNSTDTLRKDLAYKCAAAIFKFNSSMVQSNATFAHTMDATTMVIGLLYLLRSGLVHKNITVLPQYRALSYLLPPENFICLFNVKSKIITETENIVKCYLRSLTDRQIKEIGYEALDRIV